MQEDDEFGEEESNICFKNQEILVATIWIQAFNGTNFDFSTYSSDLKSVLGIHWLWCPVDKLLSVNDVMVSWRKLVSSRFSVDPP